MMFDDAGGTGVSQKMMYDDNREGTVESLKNHKKGQFKRIKNTIP
jgi:hypothetical protein